MDIATSLECPDLQQLGAFVLGSLGDRELELVGRHLEGCPACVHLLEQQRFSDPLLDVCRGCTEAPVALPPSLSALVLQLKALSEVGHAHLSPPPFRESATAHPSPPPFVEDSPDRSVPAEAEIFPRILLGRYRLTRRLGAGGMGTVYQAEDEQLKRLVAIKIPHRGNSPRDLLRTRDRFHREIRIAARVRHPHLCTIFDAGEDWGTPFVVMDYIAGLSLETTLWAHGPFTDQRRAARVTMQVAHALAAVHAGGIIHRDLKPGNILLNERDEAILTDFGLAHMRDQQNLTVEGYAVGTPAYMAPEQVSAPGAVDGRTDIYSLGLVFYQMLTGRLPFEGTRDEQAWQRCVGEVKPPSGYRSDLDRDLEAVLLRALAREPARRYGSAGELAVALEKWLLNAR